MRNLRRHSQTGATNLPDGSFAWVLEASLVAHRCGGNSAYRSVLNRPKHAECLRRTCVGLVEPGEAL